MVYPGGPRYVKSGRLVEPIYLRAGKRLTRAGPALISCDARNLEMRSALSLLHVKVERLGLPDGRVAARKNRLRSALNAIVCGCSSTIIAPYERDGHPDYEAVGEVSLEVAQSNGVPIARYPVWACHHTSPDNLSKVRWGLYRLGTAAPRQEARDAVFRIAATAASRDMAHELRTGR